LQEIVVLLAVENPLIRDGLASLIQADKDLRARIEYCDPSKVLDVAYDKKPDAVIIDRDDNALPGPCTHLLEQVPNLGIIVISPRPNCPPLYYRQSTCVEELDSSGAAIPMVLRCLRK
jgi:DNA-binding NarL/FixJ family response regulator